MNLEFDNGKYTVTDRNGHLETLRYGEPWRDHLGDNLIFAMVSEIEERREAVDKLLQYCADSDDAQYGTISTSTIRELFKP